MSRPNDSEAQPQAQDAPRDSRREAMLRLAKGAAYVAPATLALLESTKSAFAS